jgi:hypothetical protein
LGAATAFVTTVGYTGSLVGPRFIGTLTEGWGLQAALGSLIVARVGVTGLGLALAKD